jgi:hypothetical protein
VVTRRDSRIILFLMINAALNAASTTAYLAQFAPKWIVAVVGLLSSMWSAATGIYVTVTQETQKVGRADG